MNYRKLFSVMVSFAAVSVTHVSRASHGLVLIPNLASQVLDAAQKGDLEKLRELRRQHADFTVRSEEHKATPLHWVIKNCTGDHRRACVEFLVTETSLDVNAKNSHDQCHVTLAARLNAFDIVDQLLADERINVANETGAQLLFYYVSTEKEQLRIQADNAKAIHVSKKEALEKDLEVALKKHETQVNRLYTDLLAEISKAEQLVHQERLNKHKDLEKERAVSLEKLNIDRLWLTSRRSILDPEEPLNKALEEVDEEKAALHRKADENMAETDRIFQEIQQEGTLKIERFLQGEKIKNAAIIQEFERKRQVADERFAAEHEAFKRAIEKASDRRLTLPLANLLISKSAPMKFPTLETIFDMSEEERAQLPAYTREQELDDLVFHTNYALKLARLIATDTNVNALSRNGTSSKNTALKHAVLGGKKNMTHQLIKAGAYVEEIGPLFISNFAREEALALVELLKKYTQLRAFVENGEHKEVLAALTYGLIASVRYSNGMTLLHAAANGEQRATSAKENYRLILADLLKAGADPLAKTDLGKMALSECNSSSSHEFVLMLGTAMGNEQVQEVLKNISHKATSDHIRKALAIPADGV